MKLKALISVMALCVVASCSGDFTAVSAPTDAPVIIQDPPATSEDPTTTVGTKPVIIDSDLAVDGIMSILYLLGQEQLQIQAITVSGTGLVHCETGINQVLGILKLIGAEAIPVACGPESPINGFNAFPGSYRAEADNIYAFESPAVGGPSHLGAPELIASVINDSPVPVVIYVGGPQTNLAKALELDPTIASNVEMAYIMGGAFDAPGNAQKNPDAEWNIWVDPLAAAKVFRSGIPITLVPLDATNQVPLHVFHQAALKTHEESPAAEVSVSMLNENENLAAGSLFFWDQLTAGLLVDETYATFNSVSVEVAIDEDRGLAGTTLITDTGAPIRVVGSVDVSRFETDFLSAIAGTSIGPISIDSDLTGSFDGSNWSLNLPDSLEQGKYVIHMTNESAKEIGLAFGWLLGDATPQDIDNQEGTTKPPFYELESFRFTGPHSELVSVVDFASSETYVIVGLDPSANTSTAIGVAVVTDI